MIPKSLKVFEKNSKDFKNKIEDGRLSPAFFRPPVLLKKPFKKMKTVFFSKKDCFFVKFCSFYKNKYFLNSCKKSQLR